MNLHAVKETASAFEAISAERKEQVKLGNVPDWYITQGYMMFNRKYAFKGESVLQAFERIAKTLAKHCPYPEAEKKFFDIMWKGHLAPSTPVMCNTGTGRGHSVSCSGAYIGDSIRDFYNTLTETAVLSQKGYGTSAYLGDIRGRGAPISTGGEADGLVPVFDTYIDASRKVSQGNNRRGQWAGYLEMDHPDFHEMIGYILKNAGSANVGWIYNDNFIERLQKGDEEAISRFCDMMYVRSRTGKGYIWKNDHANRLTTEAIKRFGLPIRASNLCTEISLPANNDYTFSCVLSSLNLSKWDEFDADTIFWSTVFLDCVASETIQQTANDFELRKLHKFTKDFRALGLGTLGYASYLQSKMIPFESFEAHMMNIQIFKRIDEETKYASRTMAKDMGEPLVCEGVGMRNATLTAIAPNTSSAILCGGVSQGIEPIVANTYNQNTAAGEMTRMNPTLVKVLKEKGVFTNELMWNIDVNHKGSVQHLDCLDEHEKLVFRTAFEMNQSVLVRKAAARQPFISQTQSLNLFFDTDELYIASVTKEALENENIVSLYYQRSMRGVSASKGECIACEG